jgi:hypothetical protein
MCLFGDLMPLATNLFISSGEVSDIFGRFETNLVFLEKFRCKSQIWNFMEIRPVGATLIPADRQADGQKEANTRFMRLRERP